MYKIICLATAEFVKSTSYYMEDAVFLTKEQATRHIQNSTFVSFGPKVLIYRKEFDVIYGSNKPLPRYLFEPVLVKQQGE